MGPIIKKDIVCMFFSPIPTPSQVLVSFALGTFIKTTLLFLLNFFVFFYIIHVTDPIYNSLKFESTIKVINEKKYDITRFSFLEYCHLWYFFLLTKTKGLFPSSVPVCKFSWNLTDPYWIITNHPITQWPTPNPRIVLN